MSNILFVEDDSYIQLMVQRKLETAGHRVRTTASGKEGLMLALTTAPDLVLLDVMLPDMSGLEICHEIKTQLGTTAPPVLITSARGSDEDVSAAERVGADDYIIKPFVLQELLTRIQKMLTSRKDE